MTRKNQIIQAYKKSGRLSALMQLVNKKQKREPNVEEFLADFLEYYETRLQDEALLEEVVLSSDQEAEPFYITFPIVYLDAASDLYAEPRERALSDEDGKLITGKKTAAIDSILEITEEYGSEESDDPPFTVVTIQTRTENRLFLSPLPLSAFLRALENYGFGSIDVQLFR